MVLDPAPDEGEPEIPSSEEQEAEAAVDGNMDTTDESGEAEELGPAEDDDWSPSPSPTVECSRESRRSHIFSIRSVAVRNSSSVMS
jgi:hypothetical protein